MAVTIYTYPEELGDPPALDFSDRSKEWDEILAPEREWEDRLKEWCRETGNGALRGEEFSYPRGDGCARYIIWTEKPLRMIHVPTGDAWQIDDMTRRGIRLADLRSHVANRKKRDAILQGEGEHDRRTDHQGRARVPLQLHGSQARREGTL